MATFPNIYLSIQQQFKIKAWRAATFLRLSKAVRSFFVFGGWGRSILLDPVSPGEQMNPPTPPPPSATPSPCSAQARWPSREAGRGEGADRNISGYEPAAVCFSSPGTKKEKRKKVQCQRRVPPRSRSSYQGKHWSQEICSAKHRMSMVISWRAEKRPARIPALKQGGTCAQFLHKASRSACWVYLLAALDSGSVPPLPGTHW